MKEQLKIEIPKELFTQSKDFQQARRGNGTQWCNMDKGAANAMQNQEENLSLTLF